MEFAEDIVMKLLFDMLGWSELNCKRDIGVLV